MNTAQFMDGVLRTRSAEYDVIGERFREPWVVNLTHSLLGIVDEFGELRCAVDAVSSHEELGDLLWFIALGFCALDIPFNLDPRRYVDGPGNHPVTDAWKCVQFSVSENLPELAANLKAYIFYGREFNRQQAITQFQHLCWGVYRACYLVGSEPAVIMRKNQEKLRARYPERFTEEAANNRDLDKERDVLEHS